MSVGLRGKRGNREMTNAATASLEEPKVRPTAPYSRKPSAMLMAMWLPKNTAPAVFWAPWDMRLLRPAQKNDMHACRAAWLL